MESCASGGRERNEGSIPFTYSLDFQWETVPENQFCQERVFDFSFEVSMGTS
jgi:hypothetical protein